MKIRKLFSAVLALTFLFVFVPAAALASGLEATASEALAMYRLDSVWSMLEKAESEAIASGMSRENVISAVHTAALNLESVDADSFSDFDNDGFFFTVNGMQCAYDYRLRNELDNTAASVDEKVVLIKGSANGEALRDAGSPNVLLVAPYYGHDGSFTDQYKNEAQSIAQETGGDYLLIQSTAATGPAIAENFPDKGVVIYDSHGVQSGTSSYLCLTTNAGITQEDYQNGWAVRAGGAAYIDGRYIENHVSEPLSDCFVWMAICEGMKRGGQGTTGSALLRAGAGAVYGYSQSVTFAGDYLYEETFWRSMKEDNATVAEAYAHMIDVHGIPDPYGDAYPIVMSSVDSFPTDPDGPQTVNCDWTLFGALDVVALADFSLDIEQIELYQSYSVQVNFMRDPINANDFSLVWSSDNEAVASVTGNNRRASIYAEGPGTAAITCTVIKNGEAFASKQIAVSVKPDTSLYDSLNVEGGTLEFTTSATNRFIAEQRGDRLIARSGNRDINLSTSVLTLELDMLAGETLAFDYLYSTEQDYDFYYFKVNGQQIHRFSGILNDWANYTYTAESDGRYVFEWSFVKDDYVGEGEDGVLIDNVVYSGDSGPAVVPGDVDGDSAVTAQDAVLALRISIGIVEAGSDLIAIADLDGDGSITASDAILILRLALGL